MSALLSRKSSHKQGCIRRSPASHCCHGRSVPWINSAACASTLNAQQRRATSPPPPQEKPQASTGSTKAHEPTALANWLGAFF